MSFVTTLTRLWPYIRPYRRRLVVAFGFAILVGLFWGMSISTVFPIVKVLLEGQSLHTYVAERVRESETQIQQLDDKRSRIEKSLSASAESLADPRDELEAGVPLLSERARVQSRLSTATRNLAIYRWLQYAVLPWVPEDQFDTFALILCLLLVSTIIKSVFMFVQEVLVGSVVQLATLSLRKACLRSALRQDYQSLATRGSSDILSRFTHDMDTLAQGLLILGGKVLREPLKAVSCIILAFWVNWQLTTLSLVFVPLALLVFHRFGSALKKASHRSMESMSRMYKVLEETFDALKVVIAFNGAPRHHRKFHHENKVYYQKSMNIVVIDSLSGPTVEVLGVFAVMVAMLPGAYLVLRQTKSIWGINLAPNIVDVAELAVLYALLAGISDPVRKLSSVYARLKRSVAAAERVFSLLDQKSLVQEAPDAVALPRHARTLEFRKVGFRYRGTDGDRQRGSVLEDVSLNVKFGEVIALVGENGCGKSTLVNLLPRYFDPDQGSVLIDGKDIRDGKLRSLRDQLGVVTQETLLFDESIYENILYGRPEATREEVLQAAEQAHVSSFVEQFPEGFETRVGERGQRLSGGQRQRVALARAILRDPAILILDEATSAVDSQSEYLIHQTLAGFVRGRTTFIITHSVTQSVLDLVTRIVVLDQGRVAAMGTHAELVQSCDTYRRLYSIQLHAKAA